MVNIHPIFSDINIDESGVNVAGENVSFEYALTNLRVDESGKCIVIEDEFGFFRTNDSQKYLDVEVTVKDHFGNQAVEKVKFDRIQ